MKNKALALRALEKDCEIAGCYLNNMNDPKTCVLGRLALLAGVRRARLLNKQFPIRFDEMKSVSDAIERKFGLTIYEQAVLQSINDYWGDKYIGSRRREILKYVKSL